MEENKITVIAWDGKVLACDSRSSIESHIVSDGVKKIIILDPPVNYGDDTLLAFAYAGELSDVGPFLHHLYNTLGMNLEVKFNLWGIIVGAKHVYHFEGSKPFFIPYNKKQLLSEGSGAAFALSAMTLGLTSEQAIKHTIKLDAACGGKVQKWPKGGAK